MVEALSSSARRSSSSHLQPARNGSSINAFSPLEFCEILHAYWLDRSAGTLVPVSESALSKNKKGKGRATSPSSAATTAASGLPDGSMQRKRLIREGKSFYARIDLAASQSCVRHIEALQSDISIRNEIEKLVTLAQASASHASTTREDSGNPPTPGQSGSPSKRHFRTAQQLLHADARAETLERRIYLRLLLSRTILRYIEKHTGCKYLYQGDRVTHYQESVEKNIEKNGDLRNSGAKKARCCFWYECASGEYEQPACGGTLRIVVDLDLATFLVNKEQRNTDVQNDEGAMSLDDSEDSDSDSELAPKDATSLPRTPAMRFYGSKARRSILPPSIPLSSRSTKQVNSAAEGSATHLPASSSADSSSKSPIPHFVVALRLTHVKAHRKLYSVLRARFKEGRLQGKVKLQRIQEKMDLLNKELESLRRLQENKDDMYERGVDKLWDKIRRATSPTESDSDSEDGSVVEQDEPASQGDSVEEPDMVVEEDDESSFSNSSASEEEITVSRSTTRTRSKPNGINEESRSVLHSAQTGKHTTPLATSSMSPRSSRITAVRDVETVVSSGEEVDELAASDLEVVDHQHHSDNDSTRSVHLQMNHTSPGKERSTSPSQETDYSEPETVNKRVGKRKVSKKEQTRVISPVREKEEASILWKETDSKATTGRGRGRGRPRARRGVSRGRRA